MNDNLANDLATEGTGYGIVGAGCAGLSLAVHLVEAGFREPLHLFDRRQRFEDDRTWCAFRVDAHRFSACVSKRWSRVAVRADGRVVEKSLASAYEYIASRDFYDEALSVLRAAPNVRLHLGAAALGVEAGCITTDQGAFRFGRVFDSRYSPDELPTDGLAQCFAGAFVRTEAPCFDPERAILMDFDVDSDLSLTRRDGRASRDLLFRYVLPFDEHAALIEETYFSKGPRSTGASLAGWLEQLGPHEVLRREQGVLPMSRSKPPVTPGVTPIGLRAGAAKPSTGYAFDFIQRHSQALTRDPEARVPRSARAEFLDQVLLDELRAAPEAGPRLFRRLFERNDPERLARFMMERSSLSDDLAMMATVPSLRLVRGGALWPLRRLTARL